MTGQDAQSAVNGPSSQVAVVAIGRNEGERLRRCLSSVIRSVGTVVYVDSGSTDGSREMAREKGAHVVELDMSRPFTAARARNAGFRKAHEVAPDVTYIQFVDGDCEVETGWIETARSHLDTDRSAAVVFGRRRERDPDRSVFNRLCDIEWDVPPGPVKACGGDAMMKVEVLRAVGGYRDGMIAGEEPELCVRLRQAGWSIVCLARPMTIHDADMTRLGQWWRRALRSGHAFAEGAALHGAAPEYHSVRECRRILFWGAALPALILAATVFVSPWSALLALIYPAQVVRLFLKHRTHSPSPSLYALFTVAGNFPEALGIMKYWWDRLRGAGGAIIEYK
jgi:glycosyltransferase involved in cell wall biosynthesis